MTVPLDLEIVAERVKEKRQTFLEYNFGPLKDDFLKDLVVRTLEKGRIDRADWPEAG